MDASSTIETAPTRPADARVTLLGHLGPLDALGIGGFSLYLLVLSYLRAHKTMFWSDEVMGWLVLRSPNLHVFLQRWWGGLDSSGIFFYILATPWLHLFGVTELSLRLFSAAGVAVSFALLWATARRFVSVGIAATALPVIYACNFTLLWQLGNARSYGVLLASAALAGYAFVLAAEQRKPTRTLLLLTFCAHLLLVGSHILGPLYSAVFLAGLITQDIFFRLRRPTLYLSALAAWLLIPFSWPNLRSTSALGKPSFWTSKPTLNVGIVGLFDFSIPTQRLVLLTLIIVIAAWLARKKLGTRDPLIPRERLPLYFLIGTLYGAIVLLFVISRVTTSVYVDRYLLPVTLATALLFCDLLSRCVRWLSVGHAIQRAAFALAMLLLLYAARIFVRFHGSVYAQSPYTAQLVAQLPKNVPVLCTNVNVFIEVVFYQHDHINLYNEIDWPVQLEQASHGGGVSAMHEMENWKANGVYSTQILPTDEILARFHDFDVLTLAGDNLWVQRRLIGNPNFVTTPAGTIKAGLYTFELYRVHAS